MELLRSPKEMRAWSDAAKAIGRKVGFVPTMGFLHEGHLSLVRVARAKGCDAVVVSIFVNPTQFGPTEDFAKYPRNEERDLAMLSAEGVDAVYLPTVEAMYPPGSQTTVDVPEASNGLCGALRPGHFQGVATVVAKLFNAAKPHVAVFGEKDFQQLAVIRALARDLDFGIEVVGAPLIREADGLAMSSRNVYLSSAERSSALSVSRGLFVARDAFAVGERDAEALVSRARREIEATDGVTVEYVEGRDPETLAVVHGQVERLTLLAAVRVGKTRLIDNISLGDGGIQR